MKFIYLLLFLSFTAQSQENCTFNYYNKKGGHYLFSTYYQSDMQTKMEGTCASSFNGQLYEKRIFSNGHIIEETLNYIDFKQRIRYTLDDNPKDSIISTLKEYQENGKLKLEWIFYYNKENRRCQKTIEYFPNGKVRFINHCAWVKETELDQYLKPHYPPHTIDEDGYTYLSVPIGLEESYHENGKLATRNFNTFVVSEYAYQMSKNGPFVQYFDNGQLQITGQYKNGKVNGKIQTYHYAGALSEEKYYQNDVSIGTWKGWHANGKQWYIQIYDSLAQNPFRPSNEKYWNEQGILVKELVLDRFGTGKEKLWFQDGKPMLEEDIVSYNRYNGIKREWYATGILKRFHNTSAKADTAVIENYEDGTKKFLSTNTLNGTVQEHKQWDWFMNGILKSELIQTTGGTLNKTIVKNYYASGIQSDIREVEGEQIIEESYYENGRKKRSAFYNHGKLEGNYQTFDSLGNVLEHFHYKNGLRHGICRIYNPKGTLLFANNYEDGCMEKTTKEAIILNRRSIKDLSPGLRDSIFNLAIAVQRKELSLDPQKDFISAEQIDSTAQQLVYLFDYWKAKNVPIPFPFDNREKGIQAIRFILPVATYGNIMTGDFSKPDAVRLKHVFDSLGWSLPTDWKIVGNSYIGTYNDGRLYSHLFLYRTFAHWYYHSQIDYNYGQEIELDYGLKNNYHSYPSLSYCHIIASSCVNAFTISGYQFKGGLPVLLVYSDGSCEIYNQIKNWDELEPLEFIHEIGWD